MQVMKAASDFAQKPPKKKKRTTPPNPISKRANVATPEEKALAGKDEDDQD